MIVAAWPCRPVTPPPGATGSPLRAAPIQPADDPHSGPIAPAPGRRAAPRADRVRARRPLRRQRADHGGAQVGSREGADRGQGLPRRPASRGPRPVPGVRRQRAGLAHDVRRADRADRPRARRTQRNREDVQVWIFGNGRGAGALGGAEQRLARRASTSTGPRTSGSRATTSTTTGSSTGPTMANLDHGIYFDSGSGLVANNLFVDNLAHAVQLYTAPHDVRGRAQHDGRPRAVGGDRRREPPGAT